MSKLNPSAFSFVPGQRFTLPQQVQQSLQPVERPEQSDPSAPPPTISLNIGNPPVSHPVSSQPAKKGDEVPKSSIKFQKADGGAASKTFTTEKAKTDTNTIAQDVKNAADQAALEDLFGSIKEHLNIVFIGHVDAGKSTMGGNLLYITGTVDKRTMEKYEREAKEAGRETWYLSWALDSTPQERSKGKTVEVGRAYFETEKRRYTILDAPGHKTFVPSMISGAAQADFAILVISARKGEFETGFERGGQTREHIMLVKTAGVSKVVVAINKMDDPTVDWEKARYDEIKDKLTPFLKASGFNPKTDVTFLPVSAYTGVNLKDRVSKSKCPWWDGPSFLEYLDGMPMVDRKINAALMMPVSEKYKDMGTIVVGKIESGHLKKGDNLVLMPNKTHVDVAAIYSEVEEELELAISGDNVRIRLRGVDDEDIYPGFVLTSPNKPIHAVRQFEAQLAILEHKNIICAGYSAVMHIHTLAEEVTLTALLHYFDKATGRKSKKPPQFAKKGQKIVALIETALPICVERFVDYPQLGRFTLRDEGRTIAIGKITKLVEHTGIDEVVEGVAHVSIMSQALLSSTFSDISLLLETSTDTLPSHNISDVLKKRLLAYYHHRNDSDALQRLESVSSEDELELLTTREALSVVQKVQAIMEMKGDNGHEEPPLLGTRDLAKLRTLLSVAVKWGLVPLYARVSKSWSKKVPENVLDATAHEEPLRRLSELTATFIFLIFPDGAQGRISQTLITTSILSRHVSDILLPAVALGWLPEALSKRSMPVLNAFPPLVARLMNLLSASQAISVLGSIVSSSPPLHVRSACTTLLTKQLLRPDGVDGLCRAMFSEEESIGDEAQLDKLEQIARIVNSVPSSLEPQVYYSTIFPQVLQVLTGSSQTSHRRAAAFAIYRALVPKKATKTSAEATYAIHRLLHEPFLRHSIEEYSDSSSSCPRAALDAIVTLVGNAEPSPTFISKLLSPIVIPLYGLSYDLSNHKTVDPQLRESLLGLLKSWAKIVNQFEGEQVLLLLIESGKDWDWKFNAEGNFWRFPRQRQDQPALLLPQNVTMTGTASENYDMNIFDFFPDPTHLVETLKAFERGDIASSLFVRLFERYVAMKGQPGQDPMKIFHILQIIVQMQERLSEGTTSNILRRPDKLFPFIHRVLTSLNMETTNHEDDLPDSDSDDEEEGPNTIGPDHDLLETTITLLLSVLEADETVSVVKYPILEEISSVLEPLALHGPNNLRPITREAKLVLTARLAQPSNQYGQKDKAERDPQEIYQRSLKLLQDPMLPVRAHGLLLLRELLSTSRAEDQATLALVPSILSIFLQSVQDDDSYIFLNGVQGLATLAERFGKEIIQGLVRDYTGNLMGLGATNPTSHDVDVRTRIGEAISSVIKQCGSTLGLYVDLLVPPLLAVIRNADIPTVLRTSSISLLADCVGTWPLALLPYIQDLCLGFIDLLQVETSAARDGVRRTEAGNAPGASPPATMDSNPTLKNPKIPALRRSAIHFLGSYIRATTKLIYDEGNLNATIMIPKSLLQKASITLNYISSTDDDSYVRVMAKEARENLKDLQRAVLGLP